MTGGEPLEPVAPPQRRPGVDVAREALAAARAQARRRGTRPGGTAGFGSGGTARLGGGDPSQRSGARPDDRDPQPLAGTLRRLLADRGWEADAAVGGVLGRWDQIVGPDVAAHCRPDGYELGVLTVSTDTTAWATQMRLLAPSLVRRLCEECGDGAVTRVVVRGPRAPSWRRGGRSVRGRGPRDTYG